MDESREEDQDEFTKIMTEKDDILVQASRQW